jgi:UDP-N-acetylmuramoyl-L-alanyl-D-glutamate--2,6-diaminopimelate ligase
MQLSSLLDALPSAVVSGPVGRGVGRVTDVDAEVGPGDVFVAIRGARTDGHDRVAGLGHAAALVVEREVGVPPGPTVIRVPDSRAALAPLAAARAGNPARAMAVVGITGTNGKTSTSFLVAAMARAAGMKAGIVGTTGHFIGDERVEATHTTPSAPVVQALLARMRDAGCRVVAMEASSIGLASRRVDAIPFAAAVFTNLTRDHLDYHGSMEAYAAAKARLFHELLAGRAVLNAGDAASAAMAPRGRPIWWFNGGDLRALHPAFSLQGCRARIVTPLGEREGSLRLLGEHALDNALGALGAALAVGVPLEAAMSGMAELPCVPGRMEPVPNSRGLTVLVDYAHTDDALARVLGSLRRLGARRVVTVFGCGGDRDRGKRPLMGRAAAADSDLVVITSDNPRTEEPGAIIADILPGVGERACRVEPDRAAAIRLALGVASAGDVVLIAGKGHEPYQEIEGRRLPFDDRAVAADALA